MTIIDLLGHLSFVIFALSIMMKDIVWLRIVSIFGSIFAIGFNYYVPGGPIWIVIGWSLVFIMIHLYNLVILIRERQGVNFTPEEKEIFETVFRGFSPVEFMKLLRIGEWRSITENEKLVKEGECFDDIIFIYNGEASISSNGKVINSLKDGAFIGEMGFLSGNEATATVQSKSPLRCLVWPGEELKKLLMRNPSMNSALQTVFNTDLMQKLVTTTA